jgi:LysM repeat protein
MAVGKASPQGKARMAQRPAHRGDDFREGDGLFRHLRPLLAGLLAALLIGLTLLAAVILATEEQELVAVATPSATSTAAATTTATATAAATPAPTTTATSAPTATATPASPTPSPRATEPSPAPSFTPSRVPPKKTPRPTVRAVTRCVPPSNWQPYTVQWGDSLSAVAWRYWTSVERIAQANCMKSYALYAGQRIYVPDVPPRQWCGRPPGWVAYLIQQGDTLFSIAGWVGTTVPELKQANCLESDKILAGAELWVPHLPWRPPYGGGIVVPPELAGESPIPNSSSQARVVSVVASTLLIGLLAAIKIGVGMKKMQTLMRPSHRHATNERSEVG